MRRNIVSVGALGRRHSARLRSRTRFALVYSRESANSGQTKLPPSFRKNRCYEPYKKLQTFNPASGDLNAIIDTPKGSRNKYSYREATGLFELGGLLPTGAVFPFDFGFVPHTLGGDDDPLDVLILMDEPAFVGCVVPARLLGLFEAEQTEKGKTVCIDRLVAVAVDSPAHCDFQNLGDLNERRSRRHRALLHFLQRCEGKEVQAARPIRPGRGADAD